jgi:radical SAM superfamily enzyme YgiQ (UPF0313 family)
MRINFVISPLPFLGDPKRNAPLGVMYLAAVAEREGCETTITDLRDKTLKENQYLIPLADIYGFSATTPEYFYCKEIAKELKQKYPDSLLIIGGAHATAHPDKVDNCFDIIVVGEGERAIANIIRDFKKGKVSKFYKSTLIEDISEIPFPARHLLPESSFISYQLVEKNRPATTILTSRGCVFDCSFCASKIMWQRKLRHRATDNIIAEIEELKERYGVEQLRFQDDTLASNKKWLFEFCDKLESLGLAWRVNERVDTSSKDVLSAMKKAGCTEICYGIESTEQRVLNKCNKKLKIEQVYQALKNAEDVGIKTRIFFIIGLPEQNEDVADNMINFIKKTKPYAVDLSTFIPFPGSDIYNYPEKYGIKLKKILTLEII